MSLTARTTKANGTTSWVDGDNVTADELNGDFDNVYDTVNGNLNTANIASGGIGDAAIATGINASKIDDHSDAAATAHLQTDPGISGSESLATTLEGEIQRIRYILESTGHGLSPAYNDGSAKVGYYGDRAVRGANLARNGAFSVKTTGTTSAPDGWALAGTPTTCALATTDVSNGTGKCLRIVADAANEGVTQTFAGLKASTLYFIQARYIVSVGSIKLVTTGADAASDFRDLSITKTDTSWTQMSAMVATDSTPTDLVVKFLSVANADDFKIADVIVKEMSRYVRDRSGAIIVRQESTDTGAVSGSEDFFPSGDPLGLSVTVPGPGYTIRARAKCCVTAGAAANVAVTLYENSSRVDVSPAVLALTGYQAALALGYVNSNPTPGTTYSYLTKAIRSAAATANGTNNALTVTSWLEVELVPPG